MKGIWKHFLKRQNFKTKTKQNKNFCEIKVNPKAKTKMSRLSRRRGGKPGPVTSTQDETGSNNSVENDESLSREERVFKRQLEAAIEISKKTASAEISTSDSSQELKTNGRPESEADKIFSSQELTKKPPPPPEIIQETIILDESEEEKLTLKRKCESESENDEKIEVETVSNRRKLRKIILSDDESDEDFCFGVKMVKNKPKKAAKKLIESDSSDDEFTGFGKKNVKKSKKVVQTASEAKNCVVKLVKHDLKPEPLEESKTEKLDSMPTVKKETKPQTTVVKIDTKIQKSEKIVPTPAAPREKNIPKPEKIIPKLEKIIPKLEKNIPKPEKIIPKPDESDEENSDNDDKEPLTTKKENIQPKSPALGAKASLVSSMPRWTPPARLGTPGGSSSNLNIAGQSPSYRLGLSRNVKVKPLHPNVKLT
jgi:hypothetical protein